MRAARLKIEVVSWKEESYEGLRCDVKAIWHKRERIILEAEKDGELGRFCNNKVFLLSE